MKTAIVSLCGVLALTVGCQRNLDQQASPPAAASNSYLAAAVRDVLGAQTPVETLAAPGTCPGHFDMRPSQMETLRRCRVLLMFDFQRTLADKLERLEARGLHAAVIHVPGGMCDPDSYADACGQVAAALVKVGLIDERDAAARTAAIQKRMRALRAELIDAAATLAGAPVLCSAHQQAFCKALGLDIRATFGGVDSESAGHINDILAGNGELRCVIANRPEGAELAQAIASRTGAPLVVFDNFPTGNGAQSFDALVRDNVRRLADTVAP